jgi:diguanylate cyclase (GGDEF)-like protein/PAS domain S-box-containing protein
MTVRLFTLIVSVIFGVEVLVMLALDDLMQNYPTVSALLDATIVSTTLLICLDLWVFPQIRIAQNEAKDQIRLQETLINAIPAPVFYKNELGVYIGCNKQFEAYLGRPREQIVNTSVFDVAPEDLAEIYHKADMDLIREGGSQIYETRVVHADGSKHDVMFHKAVFEKSNGMVGGIIGVMVDITQRKELENKLEELASHDTLTGLSNRRDFDARLEQALARSQRTQTQLALLFLDLDGFKDVNDNLGHSAGDQVLQIVAERLTKIMRKSDTAGRMGGDEFAVILEGSVTRDTAALVAEKILAELASPYTLNEGAVSHLSASIGIAFAPDHGTELDTLFASADRAMYSAKDQGKNRFAMATSDAIAPPHN